MDLQIHTMQSLYVGVCICLAMTVGLVARNGDEEGLQRWALALCCNSAAYILWGLHIQETDPAAIPLAQGIISLAYVGYILAICRFFRRKVPWWQIGLPPAAMLCGGIGISLVFRDAPMVRTLFANLVLFLQAGQFCILLAGCRMQRASRGRILMFAACGIVLAVGLARIGIVLMQMRGTALPAAWPDPRALVYFAGFFTAIFATFGFVLMTKERSDAALRSVALRDELTGCCNRVRMAEVVEQELARLTRYGYPVTLIMADIDHFKRINDRYGHQAGDEVLRDFAEIARRTLRTTDFLGRWGGEEFVAILPSSFFADALPLAERWRLALARHAFGHGQPVTASFGISSARSTDRWEDWLGRADQALYAAKASGRNCCRFENIDIGKAAQGALSAPVMQLRWSPAYETGHAEIDRQHKDIVDLANALLLLDPEADFRPALRAVLEATRRHFAYENDVLASEADPDAFADHRARHGYLLQRAETIQMRASRGEIEAAALFHFVIFEFVAQHILIEDRNDLRPAPQAERAVPHPAVRIPVAAVP